MNSAANRVVIGMLFAFSLLAIFFSSNISRNFEVLGLVNAFILNRESFFILLAAFIAVPKKKSIVSALALIVGSFFTGPFIAALVGMLVVYERAQRVGSSWYLLKDYFFLLLLVFSCGLPNPLSSAVVFVSVVGISLDFGIGVLSLMPAILFCHTSMGLPLANEINLILVGAIVFAHLIYIWLSGHKAAYGLWQNAIALSILSSSFLIKDHSIFPTILMAAVLNELIFNIKVKENKYRQWIALGSAAVLGGGPFFIGQATSLTLAEKGVFWAIPILPLFVMYSALSCSTQDKKEEQEIYPYWLLILSVLFTTSVFWWSTLFSPAVEAGNLGLKDSVMGFLFEKSASELVTIDSNVLLIATGLVLLGYLGGYVLFRFYLPERKTIALLKKLSNLLLSARLRITQLSGFVPENQPWVPERIDLPYSKIDYLLKFTAIAFVVVGFFWTLIRFLRSGGLI